MKDMTFSADERLIEAAHTRARSEDTTLNAEFCRWLESYAQPQIQVQCCKETLAALQGKIRVGRKFTRDEMNER